MREPLSRTCDIRPAERHAIVPALVYASLTVGIALLSNAPVFAQAALPSQPPTMGMGATSPLSTGSTRPTGIPLGSTEITTPGISPVDPSQTVGTTNCAGSDGAGPSAAPFDGGGFSGSTQLSCADSQTIPSPLPSPSLAGRAGIPLGATELGGAGISPAAPVAAPNPPAGAGSTTSPGNP
jgi:hypothetical protein